MFTKQNIGIALTGVLGLILCFSVFNKLGGGDLANLGEHHMKDWMFIIGIGELLCLILFVIPKTMNLGTLLLSCYWGGAIVFHMAHPQQDDPAMTGFLGPVLLLILTWLIAWLRGMKII